MKMISGYVGRRDKENWRIDGVLINSTLEDLKAVMPEGCKITKINEYDENKVQPVKKFYDPCNLYGLDDKDKGISFNVYFSKGKYTRAQVRKHFKQFMVDAEAKKF